MRLLVVCTGNAARSVMAGSMLGVLGGARGLDLRITTAGTHTVDGQPMSARTRGALASIGAMAGVPVSGHRSRQLAVGDPERADLVVGMEADHVRFVRRVHPEAAGRCATLRRLAGHLPAGPGPLGSRVAALGLESATLDEADDVVDPAGGDESFYVACAQEIWALCGDLVERLG